MLTAYNILTDKGFYPAVYTFPTIKPIDKELIEQVSREFDLIVTCEEHNIIGGFGSAVAEVMAELKDKRSYLVRIGINDRYSELVGDQKYLREQNKIDGEAIAAKIMGELNG